jgi:hypothetical protein
MNVAAKDFNKKTLDLLSKKGVNVISCQAIPAFEGDKYFTGTAYMLDYNGHGFSRTHAQVLIMANSSWTPEVDGL